MASLYQSGSTTGSLDSWAMGLIVGATRPGRNRLIAQQGAAVSKPPLGAICKSPFLEGASQNERGSRRGQRPRPTINCGVKATLRAAKRLQQRTATAKR